MTIVNTPDTFMCDPFDSRDLPNVLDRVNTPVAIHIDGVFAGLIKSAHLYRWGGVEVMTVDDERVNVEGGLIVNLVGPVDVLDAPGGVIAYATRDGERLCADHGAVYDIGVSDGFVHPVFSSDSGSLDVVEYCSHVWDAGDRGHSFCGSCGTDLTMTHGAHDRDYEGPFARCWNCGTSSVYVDGEGFQYVDGFGSVLDSHRAEVTGPTVTYRTDLNGVTRVTAVNADMAPTHNMRCLQAYVSWVEADPSVGVLLILCESEDEAFEVAEEWAEEALDATDAASEEEAESMLSAWRADTRVERVDVEHVTFHPHRSF